MKKMICALLALTLMLCAFAVAETIAPQSAFDLNEGIYAVAFNRDALKDGVLNDVKLYTEDYYDIVDVHLMAVGDTFEAEGNAITIETLETAENGDIKINGGFEAENGYTLTTEEDTNGFMTTTYDDFCTYTERGTFNFELAENVTFTDSSKLDIDAISRGEEAVTATGIEAVTKAIMASEDDSFYNHNTEIVIEGGKVVEINRHYVP